MLFWDVFTFVLYSAFLLVSVACFVVAFSDINTKRVVPTIFCIVSLLLVVFVRELAKIVVLNKFDIDSPGLPASDFMFKLSFMAIFIFTFLCAALLIFDKKFHSKYFRNDYVGVKKIKHNHFIVAKKDFVCLGKEIKKGTVGAKLANYSAKNFKKLGIDNMCFWADSKSTIFCDDCHFSSGEYSESNTDKSNSQILIEESNILDCTCVISPIHLKNCCLSRGAFIKEHPVPFNYCKSTDMYYRVTFTDSIRKDEESKMLPCGKDFIVWVLKKYNKTKISIINAKEIKISKKREIPGLYYTFESWEDLSDFLFKNCTKNLDEEKLMFAKSICLCVSLKSWLFDDPDLFSSDYTDFHFAQLCGALIDLLLFDTSELVKELNKVSTVDIMAKERKIDQHFIFVGNSVLAEVGPEQYAKILSNKLTKINIG